MAGMAGMAGMPGMAGMAGMPPQQQQPHLPPGAASAAGQQPPQGALREISPVFLCRIGQETVQDIVTRTMEIFQITRSAQVLRYWKLRMCI
ncbi:Mediator of RNA polymerase II transcription subunit 30 [Liparis tanakae]|uniref:Mediator of RNA polymerase II transcription subunit 30 n=1 Tax=Liparis tanakae TaxID=230148 RepID=A0A4Z2GFQ5_9TELE|nr:Mediator of RNA polymerase II transcription subunit 30 [Liparis tanakae]